MPARPPHVKCGTCVFMEHDDTTDREMCHVLPENTVTTPGDFCHFWRGAFRIRDWHEEDEAA